MSVFDILIAIAEVAVAFAGFASLVSILGRRTSVDDPRVLGVRMRAMLLASLIVVAFALVPLVVFEAMGPGQGMWRVSTGGLLVATGAYLAWLARTFRWLGSVVVAKPFQKTVILPVLATTFVLLVSALLVNVVVAGPPLYLAALGLLLFQSGFAFSLIVFSFLPRIGAVSGDPAPPSPAGPVREDEGP